MSITAKVLNKYKCLKLEIKQAHTPIDSVPFLV